MAPWILSLSLTRVFRSLANTSFNLAQGSSTPPPPFLVPSPARACPACCSRVVACSAGGDGSGRLKQQPDLSTSRIYRAPAQCRGFRLLDVWNWRIVLKKSPTGRCGREICKKRIEANLFLNHCCVSRLDLESIFRARRRT